MHTLKNDYPGQNDDELEDVFNLLRKNIDCSSKIIHHIDTLIENKHFHESILNVLTSIRNTCAVNTMNLTRITKQS